MTHEPKTLIIQIEEQDSYDKLYSFYILSKKKKTLLFYIFLIIRDNESYNRLLLLSGQLILPYNLRVVQLPLELIVVDDWITPSLLEVIELF